MKKINKISYLLIIFFLTFSCNSSINNNIKIGAILPLTGETANYGNNLKKGMMLAEKKLNKENSKKIQIFYEDDMGSPSTSLNCFNKLVATNKVNYIIGGMFSNIALTLAPLAKKQNIILMSPTASAVELSNYGDNFFRIYPSDSYDGVFLANFCSEKLKAKVISIVTLEAASTIAITEVFEKRTKELGGIIDFKARYKNKENNFSVILQELKNKKSEVVFIPGYIEDIANLLKNAKELDCNKTFVTISTVYDKKFLDITGNTSENLIFSAPSFDINNKDKETIEFLKSFEIEYNEKADILGAYGYDVVNISYAALTESKENTVTEIANNLYKIKDYPGITGKTSFDKNGDVIKNLKIMIIKNGEFIEYK